MTDEGELKGKKLETLAPIATELAKATDLDHKKLIEARRKVVGV